MRRLLAVLAVAVVIGWGIVTVQGCAKTTTTNATTGAVTTTESLDAGSVSKWATAFVDGLTVIAPLGTAVAEAVSQGNKSQLAAIQAAQPIVQDAVTAAQTLAAMVAPDSSTPAPVVAQQAAATVATVGQANQAVGVVKAVAAAQ